MGGCEGEKDQRSCTWCGHDKKEHARRMRLPLQTGPDGLMRIYAGIPKDEIERGRREERQNGKAADETRADPGAEADL